MKGSIPVIVVVAIGAILVATTAAGFTVFKITSPFPSFSKKSSDIDFIQGKINKNVRKVCADEELERIPTETDSYMTYEFRQLEEGRLSEKGEAIILDYGKTERRISLSSECQSYQMKTFKSGVKKFWIEEDKNGAIIGVKE